MKTVTLSDFESGLQTLNLNTATWRNAPRNIYQAIAQNEAGNQRGATPNPFIQDMVVYFDELKVEQVQIAHANESCMERLLKQYEWDEAYIIDTVYNQLKRNPND